MSNSIERDNFFWHFCIVRGPLWTWFKHNTIDAVPDSDGFVRRSQFSPKVYQVVAPTVQGFVGGFHVTDGSLIEVVEMAPPAVPSKLWRDFWAGYIRNYELAMSGAPDKRRKG